MVSPIAASSKQHCLQTDERAVNDEKAIL